MWFDKLIKYDAKLSKTSIMDKSLITGKSYTKLVGRMSRINFPYKWHTADYVVRMHNFRTFYDLKLK